MTFPTPDEIEAMAKDYGVDVVAVVGQPSRKELTLWVTDPIGAVTLAEAIREKWGIDVKVEQI